MAAQGELAVLKRLIENLAKTEIVIAPLEFNESKAQRTGRL